MWGHPTIGLFENTNLDSKVKNFRKLVSTGKKIHTELSKKHPISSHPNERKGKFHSLSPQTRMGNCVFRGYRSPLLEEEMVKVITSTGGVMELYAPITSECITNEFPGHAIFRTHDLFSPPLLHNDELHPGKPYYLLPLRNLAQETSCHNNGPPPTPYRMSLHNQRVLKRSEAEVFPRYNSTGVWKVKLVISPEELAQILSQEARTEALIESVRTVAKCGSNGASTVANSDQGSVASSWKS